MSPSASARWPATPSSTSAPSSSASPSVPPLRPLRSSLDAPSLFSAWVHSLSLLQPSLAFSLSKSSTSSSRKATKSILLSVTQVSVPYPMLHVCPIMWVLSTTAPTTSFSTLWVPMWPVRYAGSWSMLTRSCCMVSRWRTVTALSVSVSLSTVMQKGVPMAS